MTQKPVAENFGDGELAVSITTINWMVKHFDTVEEAAAWIEENKTNNNIELWDVEIQLANPFVNHNGQCIVFYGDRGDDGNSKNL